MAKKKPDRKIEVHLNLVTDHMNEDNLDILVDEIMIVMGLHNKVKKVEIQNWEVHEEDEIYKNND